LNTDAELYGGSNLGNGGMVETLGEPWHDRPCSALVNVPPLGAVFLTHEDG
jgi:1,4-alpha-glucan branching enzyme